MLAIETRGLCKAYRGRNVVDGLDMHVARGDIYGLSLIHIYRKNATMYRWLRLRQTKYAEREIVPAAIQTSMTRIV